MRSTPGSAPGPDTCCSAPNEAWTVWTSTAWIGLRSCRPSRDRSLLAATGIRSRLALTNWKVDLATRRAAVCAVARQCRRPRRLPQRSADPRPRPARPRRSREALADLRAQLDAGYDANRPNNAVARPGTVHHHRRRPGLRTPSSPASRRVGRRPQLLHQPDPPDPQRAAYAVRRGMERRYAAMAERFEQRSRGTVPLRRADRAGGGQAR